MEPKDLKNSEELKVTLSDDAVLDANSQSEATEAASVPAEEIDLSAEVVEQPETVKESVSDPVYLTVDEPEIAVEVAETAATADQLVPETEAILPDIQAEEALVAEVAEVVSVAEEVTEAQVMAETAPESEESVSTDTLGSDEEPVVSETQEPEVEPEAEPQAGADAVPETDVVAAGKAEPEAVPQVIAEAVPLAESEATPVAELQADMVAAEEEIPSSAPIASEEAEPAEALVAPVAFEETEHEELDEEVQLPSDYFSLPQIDLVNLLRDVVDGTPEGAGHNAEAIIAVFFRKSREIMEEARRKFVADGGAPEEFVSEEDPYSNDVKELQKKFRQQKFEQNKKMDAEKDSNLRRKYEIIEEIKGLLNKEESINRTFQEFRELQKKWYEIGQVPQAKMKDLWDTYHFHVENFYDYIKINKELRDLDLKKNLEAKIEICEKAEELLVEPSVIKAFNVLQKLHEDWRETGPVPTDKKDDIWERFKAATSKINLKHQDYFEKRKLEQKKNYDAKIALCEKAEEISESALDTHREWDEKSKELVELQKVWKTIGFAPKRENNKVYERFRLACDKFFINKREFYSKNKDVQQVNLQMKIDLCLEAETLKESADWKKATQQFIDMQKRWKEIGPVPRKSSDPVWKRFRAACDYFFEKKSLHFSDIDGEQYENLRLKEELIAEVENFKSGDDASESLRILRDFQRRWTEIGHVPIKNKDSVQHRFRDAINRQFDSLKIDNSNRNVFTFRNKIESLTDNARGLSKVRSEREKYMIKLKQLETDLTLLDNNIGFFANSKNAQVLIADVNQKIQDTREKIEQLKEKIRIIDDLDKSEY